MWQNNYWMISRYTLNTILLECAISTSRPTAARLILQILAKYYSMYTSKSFNNCILEYLIITIDQVRTRSAITARIAGTFVYIFNYKFSHFHYITEQYSRENLFSSFPVSIYYNSDINQLRVFISDSKLSKTVHYLITNQQLVPRITICSDGQQTLYNMHSLSVTLSF